jgi:RsiW-degrading membrane proteinase PrsW (M82 family)/GNAT superfamily N-acetyltransferase
VTDPSTPPPPVYPPYPPPLSGTILQVPVLRAPVVRAPRKWLGRKGGLLIAALGAFLWFGIVLFEVIVFHTAEAPTNALLIGAFTVACAFIYTMAYRLQPSDGLSVTRLLLAFLVGGILSTTFAGPINALDNLWSGGLARNPSLLSLSLAGVVEELSKILIVMLMSIGLARKNIRNGLFLGGAVGFGFAAIENIGYAREAWNDAVAAHHAALGTEIWVVVERDVVGVFAHPLFTALLAAALFAAVRNGRFRITWRVVLVYLGVAFAHGLYDVTEPLVYRLTRLPGLALFTLCFVVAAEAVTLSLVWRSVSRRANQLAGQSVRHANPGDLPFLTAMLAEAANWDGRRQFTPANISQDPSAWRYLDGWQRPTDFGVVSMDGITPTGAAWARFLTKADEGYGYVSDSIPELTLAVTRGARRRGLGTDLLAALIESARELDLPGLSLSVEDGNSGARKIYEKAGFTVVGRNGGSDTMLLSLQG